MAGETVLRAANFRVVAKGEYADVRISPAAAVEYDKLCEATHDLGIQQLRELQRYMERFCNSMIPRLPPEHYMREGEFSDGTNGKVWVWTFKPWKWRLYGAVLPVEKRRCFVGTRVDPSKKQNKADKMMLKRTALDIGELAEYKGR